MAGSTRKELNILIGEIMCEDIDKIKQENEKLKYLVSKMYPICINGHRCTFADRLYIVEIVDELNIDVNSINKFKPTYNVVKTEPYSTRKTIMDKIVDKAIEKINEQGRTNVNQEGA